MLLSLIVILLVVLSVAIITLSERKIMGGLQRRKGPNEIGYLGLLQPFADGIKLILKETVLKEKVNNWFFLGAPFITFYLALLNWLVLPLANGLAISELTGAGILIIIAISELSIYGVLLGGWAANSKYPFLGSLRSTAQMISYSINLSLIILTVIFVLGTVNLLDIVYFQQPNPLFFTNLPWAFLFFISSVAELNRAPFDLPEAESELVAGFMTEHSAIGFTYYFLGEYTNILVFSTLFFILFFGVSISVFLIFLLIWLRASLPRLRFDQLLTLGWSHILPFTIGSISFLPCIYFTFDWLA